jgi:hypothetical protein
VDIALREGLALRWSFMGPFETIDLNAPGGAGDYIKRYSGLYDGLFESQQRRADWQGPVMGRSSASAATREAGGSGAPPGLARPAPDGAGRP